MALSRQTLHKLTLLRSTIANFAIAIHANQSKTLDHFIKNHSISDEAIVLNWLAEILSFIESTNKKAWECYKEQEAEYVAWCDISENKPMQIAEEEKGYFPLMYRRFYKEIKQYEKSLNSNYEPPYDLKYTEDYEKKMGVKLITEHGDDEQGKAQGRNYAYNKKLIPSPDSGGFFEKEGKVRVLYRKEFFKAYYQVLTNAVEALAIKDSPFDHSFPFAHFSIKCYFFFAVFSKKKKAAQLEWDTALKDQKPLLLPGYGIHNTDPNLVTKLLEMHGVTYGHSGESGEKTSKKREVDGDYVNSTRIGAYRVKPLADGKDVGWGLFATQPIPDNAVIIKYSGAKFSAKNYEHLLAISGPRENQGNSYGAETLDKCWVYDARNMGNLARFANSTTKEHANCELIDKNGELFLYAIKSIPAGGQLLYEYARPFEGEVALKPSDGWITDEEYKKTEEFEMQQLSTTISMQDIVKKINDMNLPSLSIVTKITTIQSLEEYDCMLQTCQTINSAGALIHSLLQRKAALSQSSGQENFYGPHAETLVIFFFNFAYSFIAGWLTLQHMNCRNTASDKKLIKILFEAYHLKFTADNFKHDKYIAKTLLLCALNFCEQLDPQIKIDITNTIHEMDEDDLDEKLEHDVHLNKYKRIRLLLVKHSLQPESDHHAANANTAAGAGLDAKANETLNKAASAAKESPQKKKAGAKRTEPQDGTAADARDQQHIHKKMKANNGAPSSIDHAATTAELPNNGVAAEMTAHTDIDQLLRNSLNIGNDQLFQQMIGTFTTTINVLQNALQGLQQSKAIADAVKVPWSVATANSGLAVGRPTNSPPAAAAAAAAAPHTMWATSPHTAAAAAALPLSDDQDSKFDFGFLS